VGHVVGGIIGWFCVLQDWPIQPVGMSLAVLLLRRYSRLSMLEPAIRPEK